MDMWWVKGQPGERRIRLSWRLWWGRKAGTRLCLTEAFLGSLLFLVLCGIEAGLRYYSSQEEGFHTTEG